MNSRATARDCPCKAHDVKTITIFLREAGNQLKTARILGINRNTLRTKIKEY